MNQDTISLEDLILKFDCKLLKDADLTSSKTKSFVCIKTLLQAQPNEISFLTNDRYLNDALKSSAGAIICSLKNAQLLAEKTTTHILIAQNPYATYARIAQFLHRTVHCFSGQSHLAYVDPTARVHPSATLFPFSFVGRGAVINENTVIYPGVFVGMEAHVGNNCILYANSVIGDRCKIGDRCILNPGAVLGGDGFGFAPQGDENIKIPHGGAVIIEDDVEIGANTTIDRGVFDNTHIGKQTKIDNLVQIAHGVTIGQSCLLAAFSGVAGSSQLGKRVTLAGQAGVIGHLTVGDYVTVGAQSIVAKSLPQGPQMYSGNPARPHQKQLRWAAKLNRLVTQQKREEEPSP